MSLFSAQFLKAKFEAGLSFKPFVESAAAEGHDGPWRQRFAQLELSADQRKLVSEFTRDIRIVSITGAWCGDCALQGAALARIAEANPDRVELRFLHRDPHADLLVKTPINAGFRVPVTFFLAEDFELVSRFGDRTLSRYRSMARKQLGEACPPLGAPAPNDPVARVMAEMLDEVERVHLLLRTSGRLRRRHGD
ncbi:MAG: thioredoxin family protein [Phycisphaerales bacterium]